jgi:putative DNA primase/helicase
MLNARPRQDNTSVAETQANPRPAITCNVAGIPRELQASGSWVHWFYVLRDDSWAKVPRRFIHIAEPPTGYHRHWVIQPIDQFDPRSWLSFEDAMHWPLLQNEFFDRTAIGLGLVLSDADPYTFIDLDDCRDPATGDVAAWALDVVRRFDSFTEISNSGTGLKIYIRGRKPGRRCRTSKRPGIEIYDRARFAAVTGWHFEGTPDAIADRQAELDAFYAELFPAEEHASVDPPRRSTLPTTLTDAELLDRILNSANGDQFRRLWSGDASKYRHADGKPDHSAADFAMAGTLAFWCRGDATRIESLMRQSGLVRDKWSRPNYLVETIKRAIAGTPHFYGDGRGSFEAGGHQHFEEFADMTADDVADNVRAIFKRDRGHAQGQHTHSHASNCPCQPPAVSPNAHTDFSEFAGPAAAAPSTPLPKPKKAREHAPGCMFFCLVYNLAGHAEVRRLLCGRWSCSCCGGLLQTKWKAHARTVIEHLVEVGLGTTKRIVDVHIGTVSGKKAWQRVKKQIQRAETTCTAGGQYIRVATSHDEFTVCATVPFDGSTAILPPSAASRISAAISAIPTRAGTRSPIHTSRGWKLPPRPKPEWMQAGSFHKGTKQDEVVKTLGDLGYQTTFRTPGHKLFGWAARFMLLIGQDESVHEAAKRTFNLISSELLGGFELLPIERRANDGQLRGSPSNQELLLAT